MDAKHQDLIKQAYESEHEAEFVIKLYTLISNHIAENQDNIEPEITQLVGQVEVLFAAARKITDPNSTDSDILREFTMCNRERLTEELEYLVNHVQKQHQPNASPEEKLEILISNIRYIMPTTTQIDALRTDSYYSKVENNTSVELEDLSLDEILSLHPTPLSKAEVTLVKSLSAKQRIALQSPLFETITALPELSSKQIEMLQPLALEEVPLQSLSPQDITALKSLSSNGISVLHALSLEQLTNERPSLLPEDTKAFKSLSLEQISAFKSLSLRDIMALQSLSLEEIETLHSLTPEAIKAVKSLSVEDIMALQSLPQENIDELQSLKQGLSLFTKIFFLDKEHNSVKNLKKDREIMSLRAANSNQTIPHLVNQNDDLVNKVDSLEKKTEDQAEELNQMNETIANCEDQLRTLERTIAFQATRLEAVETTFNGTMRTNRQDERKNAPDAKKKIKWGKNLHNAYGHEHYFLITLLLKYHAESTTDTSKQEALTKLITRILLFSDNNSLTLSEAMDVEQDAYKFTDTQKEEIAHYMTLPLHPQKQDSINLPKIYRYVIQGLYYGIPDTADRPGIPVNKDVKSRFEEEQQRLETEGADHPAGILAP